jgi:hypothetical protein
MAQSSFTDRSVRSTYFTIVSTVPLTVWNLLLQSTFVASTSHQVASQAVRMYSTVQNVLGKGTAQPLTYIPLPPQISGDDYGIHDDGIHDDGIQGEVSDGIHIPQSPSAPLNPLASHPNRR